MKSPVLAAGGVYEADELETLATVTVADVLNAPAGAVNLTLGLALAAGKLTLPPLAVNDPDTEDGALLPPPPPLPPEIPPVLALAATHELPLNEYPELQLIAHPGYAATLPLATEVVEHCKT